MKNDRWYESWFGAPPPANPARDTNGLDRCKSHRSRPLVSLKDVSELFTTPQIWHGNSLDSVIGTISARRICPMQQTDCPVTA
jgi:hypothetical protein